MSFQDVEDRSSQTKDEGKISQTIEKYDDESPIEQVRLTVPNTDDPTLPVLTFRMLFLGSVSCFLLTFVNTFFLYHTQPVTLITTTITIVSWPIGMFMAKVLPTTKFRILGCGDRKFSLNPGPFNIKEHVLISIFASTGGYAYASSIVTIIKVYYHRHISFYAAWILVVTTQVIGYGWAGIFRKYVVEPAEMWYPYSMVNISMFRAFHEKGDVKHNTSKLKFFMIVLVGSFVWYIVPGYLFTTISSISLLCYLFPKSITAQQIGSGMQGLGVLSFTLDWSTIQGYLGSPLVSPFFTIVNVLVGYVTFVYIVLPTAYWGLNLFNAQNYPIISSYLYNAVGHKYDVESIVNNNFEIDMNAYNKQGRISISVFFAIAYGLNFASVVATLVHVGLFNGNEIYRQYKATTVRKADIHTRLMRKYKSVPGWWFHVTLALSFCLALFMCIFMKNEVQLPWWGLIFSLGIGFVFTLPIGIVGATTNQYPALNVITEYIIGYIYPGRPIANVCFKTYGYISMDHATSFLADFKLGHYMKIPPRTMFLVQVIGTLMASTIEIVVVWWLLTSVENICQDQLLPASSPWKCPYMRVFYDASVIWGLVGPKRMFGVLGNYNVLNWGFLIGAVLPLIVWLLHKACPTKSWIKLINFPVILSATAIMPPASSINFNSWIVVGIFFQFFIFRYKKTWWQKYNYILSAGLSAGVVFMGLLIYVVFEIRGIDLDWWGNQGEHCNLASCPYAKGIDVTGCPIQ